MAHSDIGKPSEGQVEDNQNPGDYVPTEGMRSCEMINGPTGLSDCERQEQPLYLHVRTFFIFTPSRLEGVFVRNAIVGGIAEVFG